MFSFDCLICSRLIDTKSRCRVTNRRYASYLNQAKKTGKDSIIKKLKFGREKDQNYHRIFKTEIFINVKLAVKKPLRPNMKKN